MMGAEVAGVLGMVRLVQAREAKAGALMLTALHVQAVVCPMVPSRVLDVSHVGDDVVALAVSLPGGGIQTMTLDSDAVVMLLEQVPEFGVLVPRVEGVG